MLLMKMACGDTTISFESEVRHLIKQGFEPKYESLRIANDGWFYMCMERYVLRQGEIVKAKAELIEKGLIEGDKTETTQKLFSD